MNFISIVLGDKHARWSAFTDISTVAKGLTPVTLKKEPEDTAMFDFYSKAELPVGRQGAFVYLVIFYEETNYTERVPGLRKSVR